VDHAVIAVRQSPERNGRSLDVLEKSLERLSVACPYPARRVEIETGVPPALKKLHTLGGDGFALEHHLEGALCYFSRPFGLFRRKFATRWYGLGRLIARDPLG
jgi:hypothetical protein